MVLGFVSYDTYQGQKETAWDTEPLPLSHPFRKTVRAHFTKLIKSLKPKILLCGATATSEVDFTFTAACTKHAKKVLYKTPIDTFSFDEELFDEVLDRKGQNQKIDSIIARSTHVLYLPCGIQRSELFTRAYERSKIVLCYNYETVTMYKEPDPFAIASYSIVD